MTNRLFLLVLVPIVFAGCSSRQMNPIASKNSFHVPKNWDKPITQNEPNDSKRLTTETNFSPDFSTAKASNLSLPDSDFTPDFNDSSQPPTSAEPIKEQLEGVASWYGPGFHGKATANGEKYDQNEMTAAHKILPMNTWVKVTNLKNKRAVVVRINDRGPYKKNRIIDLTRTAAERLGFREKGTTKVKLEILKYPKDYDHSEGITPYKQVVVQIAVFKGEKRAFNLKDQLEKKYHEIPFMIDTRKETGFHVVAGPYDQRQEATEIALSLKREGIDNFIRSYRK